MCSKTNPYNDFEYVVERKEQQRVCFGSTQERNTSAIAGKKLLKVGPCSYDIKSRVYQLLNKVGSRRGVGSLVNGAPRFDNRVLDQVPSPTRYNTSPKWPQKSDGPAPFFVNSKRFKRYENKIPGPGTHFQPPKICRRTRFDHNLGRPIMIQTVEEICIPQPVDACVKCGFICAGDYWQQNHAVFLCQPCMAEENKLHEVYSKDQLKLFKKMRNCGYMHQHEGTTAAIRLLPARLVRKKHQLENYLDLYISC